MASGIRRRKRLPTFIVARSSRIKLTVDLFDIAGSIKLSAGQPRYCLLSCASTRMRASAMRQPCPGGRAKIGVKSSSMISGISSALREVTQDVRLRNQADQASALHHRKTADLLFHHQASRLFDRSIGEDGYYGLAHHPSDLNGPHQILLFSLFEAQDLDKGGVEEVALAQYAHDPSTLQNRKVPYAAEFHDVVGEVQDIVGLQGDRPLRHDFPDGQSYCGRHWQFLLRDYRFTLPAGARESSAGYPHR